jgi:hypothetical protein
MEDNGVATATKSVVCKLGDDVTISEVGMHRLSGDLAMVAVTPDAVVKVGDEVIAIEVKCPFFGKTGQSPEADASCRAYYILQVHAEMSAVGAKRAFLISWDPHTSVIFEILFDEDLWSLVKAWLVKWWASEEAPVPCDETEAISEGCKRAAEKATQNKRVVASVRARKV